MSKPHNKNPEQAVSKEEAFEIIELATADLNLLTRAFSVIAEVCEEEQEEEAVETEEQLYLH